MFNINSSSVDLLDVRTPPKFKLQQKLKAQMQDSIENSHAGIAIPVDVDSLELEATTKKLSYFKYERPTTNSGLSTWILLSGQSSTTKPTTKKPVIKPILDDRNKDKPKENATVMIDTNPNRVIKPIFKKKSSVSSTTTTTSTTEQPTSKSVPRTTPKTLKETTKLTKIKASELNSAFNKKNGTTTANPVNKKTSMITTTTKSTTSKSSIAAPYRNNTRLEVKIANNSNVNSSSLPVEAKDQEVEIEVSTESKKKPAGTSKRKKNKNRRKKPGKSETGLVKPTKVNNNNAVTSQIYSYLAKEIMPTVGAGLVGLMVTAGLATYFLYPFGAARRTDTDIDRRDKGGSYYYSDQYNSGMLEEEAIGKVIAGMPSNSLLSNNYKSPSSRNSYPFNNSKYRLVDRRSNIQPQKYEGGFVKGSVENVPLGPEDYQSYKNEIDRKFVVGNVPKDVDEVTPVTVPEHGPRNMKLQKFSSSDPDLAPAYGPRNLRRRRRDLNNPQPSADFTEDPGKATEIPRKRRSGISNELDSDDLPFNVNYEETKTNTSESIDEITTIAGAYNVTEPVTVSEVTTQSSTETLHTFFNNVRYILFFKARIVLDLLRNASSSVTKYLLDVQNKVEDKYRNFIRQQEIE